MTIGEIPDEGEGQIGLELRLRMLDLRKTERRRKKDDGELDHSTSDFQDQP